MDVCPVTSRLGQLICYILDDIMEHLQSSWTNWAKRAERVIRSKRGGRGRNEGHDRSFCSACSWLWSLCEAWHWCQLLLSMCVHMVHANTSNDVCSYTQLLCHLTDTSLTHYFLLQDYIWHAKLSQKECWMAARLVRCMCVLQCSYMHGTDSQWDSKRVKEERRNQACLIPFSG